jgi:hypothetical protein
MTVAVNQTMVLTAHFSVGPTMISTMKSLSKQVLNEEPVEAGS